MVDAVCAGAGGAVAPVVASLDSHIQRLKKTEKVGIRLWSGESLDIFVEKISHFQGGSSQLREKGTPVFTLCKRNTLDPLCKN